MPFDVAAIIRYHEIVSDQGYVILSAAVWMTWYTGKWVFDWVELDMPHPGALATNWKSFVVLRAP